MAQSRPITDAIGAIKDLAVSLCASINCQAPHRVGHRGLVTELRLFAGALFSLETLAAELELMSDHQLDAPSLNLLDEFSNLVQFAHEKCIEDTLSAGRIDQLKQEARTARSRVTYVLARTQSMADLVLLLSLSSQTSAIGSDSHQVLDCLQMLNTAYNNRQPQSHYMEKNYLEARRSELPEYSHAALSWPDSVEEHWSVVGQQVERLFTPPPESFNFVQWALEYARETWPDRFGLHCADPGPLLDLSHGLCDGLVTPLHLAAALGLPSLCKSLLSSGADPDTTGYLGTALYCALVGQDVIVTGCSPGSWSSVLILHRGPRLAARHAVVRQLLDAGSNCHWRYRWSSAGETSLAGLAFWFSCLVNDHTIFERVLALGATIDDDFAFLVADADFFESVKPHKSTLALLVTCAFDSTYARECGLPWQREDSVLQALEHLMTEHALTFAHGLGRSKRLPHVPDDQFDELLRSALLDGENRQLERLVLDPRFHPNIMADPKYPGYGTLAHSAAECGDADILDILFSAGANFESRDVDGRTPLLCCEQARMLGRLVELGLPTTDTDKYGCNIWHYMGATGDSGYLQYLKDKDPSIEENLATLNKKNRSPLEECLLRIGQIRTDIRRHDPLVCAAQPPAPDSVMVILDAGGVCRDPAPIPYIPLAAEWSSAALVKRLVSVGGDPRGTDEFGSNALHYLTLSASPELVALLQELCKGLPIEGKGIDTRGLRSTAYGPYHDPSIPGHHTPIGELTPAETIFTNTALYYEPGWPSYFPRNLSRHPSCAGTLSPEAYTLLLTPEVVDFRDKQGRCTWARFCHHAVGRVVRCQREKEACVPPAYIATSAVTAIQCLARRGVLERYEAETGKAAVLCLREEGLRGAYLDELEADPNADADADADAEDDADAWPEILVPLARHVLKAHKSPLADEFLKSPAGIKLKAAQATAKSPAKAVFSE